MCRREDAELAVSELMRALAYDTQRGTAPDVRRNFFDGKSAIYIDGVWANTELAETTTKQEIRYAAFPGFSGETIAYANPATGYVISNDGSERQIDACVRFLKYMLSKDVQEQIVTKTHQAPSNPNISDAWIHEQVPVLADAVPGLQAGRPADPDTLFRPARQNQRPAGAAAGRTAAGGRMCSGLLFPS